MTDLKQPNEESLEAKKKKALLLWKKQKGLKYKLALNWYYEKGGSRVWLLWPWDEIYKKHQEDKRTITSIFSGLYQGEPGKTGPGRFFGFLSLLLLTASIAVTAIKGVTAFVMIASFSAGLLALGSTAYLGRATYEYFNTPKAKRTPLQKFNMLSSVPSTLLVFGLAAAAICASLALPGAIFAVAAIAGTWLLYKAWQGQKGYSIAQKEKEKVVGEINQINAELDSLKNEAEIDNALKIAQAKSELKRLENIGRVHGHSKWRAQVCQVEEELKMLRNTKGLENPQATMESTDTEPAKLNSFSNSLFAARGTVNEDESASLLDKSGSRRRLSIS